MYETYQMTNDVQTFGDILRIALGRLVGMSLCSEEEEAMAVEEEVGLVDVVVAEAGEG